MLAVEECEGELQNVQESRVLDLRAGEAPFISPQARTMHVDGLLDHHNCCKMEQLVEDW
jgi:hypothetical protein